MTSKNVGLIDKFRVERIDGKEKENAEYFVLDLANDPGAVEAIHTYISWCMDNGYDLLASDLRDWLVLIGKADW